MRVLVATSELQSPAHGDFTFCVEGELVTPVVSSCCSPDDCGCGRGFPGLASGRTTTTAMVVDRPLITPDDLRRAVTDSLERSGWVDLLRGEHGDDDEAIRADLNDIADEHVEFIEMVCSHFAPGTVVGRNGSAISARSSSIAA